MGNESYIIIGGSGFLGKNLVGFMLHEKKEVVVIGTNDHYHVVGDEKYYSVKDLKMSQAGLKNRNAVIIDLAYASVPNTSFEDPISDFSKNLYNVISHLELAKTLEAKRYVYVSSGGTVYGNSDVSHIKEDAPNYPISPYGITKMACERYVHMYHHVHGMNTCIVRPSNVFGPHQKPFRGQGFIATSLAHFYVNQPIRVFGYGEIIRDYVFVDDFCSAIDDVIRFGKNGEVYNIGSGVGLSINEIIASINQMFSDGRTLKSNFEPGRRYDVKRNILDTTKITSLNGWRPQHTFDEGLKLTWQWMKSYLMTNTSR